VITAVIGLDVLNDALLKQPAYPPAVYGVPSEAVELPTKNALRLAVLDAGEEMRGK